MNILQKKISIATNPETKIGRITALKVLYQANKDLFNKKTSVCIKVDFTNCKFLNTSMTVILGAIANLADVYSNIKNDVIQKKFGPWYKKKTVIFDTTNKKNTSSVIKYLEQNNFLSHYFRNDNGDYKKYYNTGSSFGFFSIPSDEFDKESMITTIEKWITRKELSIGPDHKRYLIMSIIEIILNIKEHAFYEDEYKLHNIIICGSYVKKDNYLQLSVIDTGLGIIDRVKKYFRIINKPKFENDIEYLKWALEIKNSTFTNPEYETSNRGLGLNLIKEFIFKNGGEFELHTKKFVVTINPENGEFDINDNSEYYPENVRPIGTFIFMKVDLNNKIKVVDVINSRIAIDYQAGNLLYKKIKDLLDKTNKQIIVDFDEIEYEASPFFNVSIAKFLKEDSESFKRLKLINLSNVAKLIIETIKDNRDT